MTESTNVKIKTEEPDEAEIRELAAKMVEANKAKAASVAAARPQPGALLCAPATAVDEEMVIMMFPTITPGTQQQTPVEPRPTSNDKITPAPDEASWKGHFGWDTLGECHIPYIYRCGEKYVSLRMVEIKLLNKYLNCLHADLYSFTCIQSYYITAIEAQLLNEINNKYCDGQFGRVLFTQKDLVVRLKDAYEFYNFLDVCYNKLLCGTTNNEKCGFIMINKESAVPYTVRDGKKFVPLFYFEGEIDNLKLMAEQLTGWDVSYIKFCCKVQGISNEFFASETCSVISLTDIKSYFSPETDFEEYWPKKVVDSQLLNSVKGSVSRRGQWIRAPPGPPPGAVTGVLPNSAIQVAIVQQPRPLVRSTANTTTMKSDKVAKTNAQRQREFQQRKRNQQKSTKKTPKTNAEHQRAHRRRQNAEHQRAYRQRQNMKKKKFKRERTAYNHTMAEQPDEPMDVVTKAQDAAAFASATPFAEPPIIAAPKSKAQKQLFELSSRNAVKCKYYRIRKKARQAALEISSGTPETTKTRKTSKSTKTAAERARMYRLRKKQLAEESK